jgi:hypothetical protein
VFAAGTQPSVLQALLSNVASDDYRSILQWSFERREIEGVPLIGDEDYVILSPFCN